MGRATGLFRATTHGSQEIGCAPTTVPAFRRAFIETPDLLFGSFATSSARSIPHFWKEALQKPGARIEALNGGSGGIRTYDP